MQRTAYNREEKKNTDLSFDIPKKGKTHQEL